MNYQKKILTVIFLLFILIQSMITPAYSDDIKYIKSIRTGHDAKSVKIIIDLTEKCKYSLRAIDDPSCIYVDLFDALPLQNFRMPNLKPDPLLGRLSIVETNFRQSTLIIPLAYGIPVDNVRSISLDNPDRITIIIDRDYFKFSQFFITKNILWTQTESGSRGKFSLINELFIRHRSDDVTVDVETAKSNGKSRETVDDMLKRTNAIAGINGGYFSKNGEHLGLLVDDEKLVAPSIKRRPPRTAFILHKDKSISLSKLTDKDGKVHNTWGKPVSDILIAIGAGPRLLEKGIAKVTANEEGLGPGGNNITNRTGRTAVGVTDKGNLAIITISGFRNNEKDGFKLPELAAYMKTRGIVEAMNFDGGGSTAMSILGYPVAKPPMQGKYQRPVTNALLIYDKSPIIAPYDIKFAPSEITLPADGQTDAFVKVTVIDKNGKPVPNGTAISIAAGIGLFKTKYHYTKNGSAIIKIKSVQAPGNYSIKIDSGPTRKYLALKLEQGEPANLSARSKSLDQTPTAACNPASPAPMAPQPVKRYIIEALLRDKYSNPVAGRVVEFSISGGQGFLSAAKVFTKPNGVADTGVTMQTATGKIRITSDGVPPITVNVGELTQY